MDSARDRADNCRREHRMREKDRTKEIGWDKCDVREVPVQWTFSLCVHDIPSDELKQLCEGGCSVSDIEEKRRDFTQELAEMRTTAEVIPLPLQPSFPLSNSLSLCFLVCHFLQLEQNACSLALRNTHLGEDRYGRTFWHLQVHVPLIKGCS